MGLFCPSTILFFDCLGVRNICAKFHAFITICTIVVVMALTKNLSESVFFFLHHRIFIDSLVFIRSVLTKLRTKLHSN